MPSELEASFQFLTENSIDIICRAQADMVLSYVSPSSFHVLGWLPAEMIGERWDAFFLPEDAFLVTADFSAMAARSPVTVRMRRKNGGSVWVEVRCRVISESEIIILMRDISERKNLAERLSAFEGSDARTGLSTARALEEALDREWSRMVREGSQLSLLLLDFNGFRQFHSGSTHFEGDRCLAEIATAVHPVLRLTDAAAHYRAEQIAILLSGTGAYGAATVAAKLRSAIRALRPTAATARTIAMTSRCTSASPARAPVRQPPIACLSCCCWQPRARCIKPSSATPGSWVDPRPCGNPLACRLRDNGPPKTADLSLSLRLGPNEQGQVRAASG